MPLRDQAILQEDGGRPDGSAYQAAGFIPRIRVVFGAAAYCDADGVLVLAATCPANALNIIRAGGWRVGEEPSASLRC